MSSRLLTGPRARVALRTLDESGYGEASRVTGVALRLPGDIGEIVLLGDSGEDPLDEWVGFEREGDRGIAQR